MRRYRADGRYKAQRHATHRVMTAVRNGNLPSPDKLECVDCGGEASQYDHRDYSKPLEVVPVCRRCNKLRGPGLHG